MKRKQALETIIKISGSDDAIISSTGLMSRELFEMGDSPRNFYMVGSMGLASSIGLGIALIKKSRKIIVVEGDASLLMNLGTLPTIGHFKPKNLIHIVLDNGVYESCSGEPSISKTANFEKIAKNVGYTLVKKISNQVELKNILRECLTEKYCGPVFILAKIKPGGKRDLARPLKLDELAERFKSFLVE